MDKGLFTDVLTDVVSHLNNNIKDYPVEPFYTNDSLEVVNEFVENQNLSRGPTLLCTVATSDQIDRRTIPTDVQEQMQINVFIGCRNARFQQEAFKEAETIAFLTQAYLAQVKFGTDYSNSEHPFGFTKDVEYLDDQLIVYRLRGNLELEISLNALIDQYES